MGAIILLALYGLAITSLGSYEDYMRFHISFDPLLIVIVWGNLHVGSSLIVKYGPGIIGRVAKSL